MIIINKYAYLLTEGDCCLQAKSTYEQVVYVAVRRERRAIRALSDAQYVLSVTRNTCSSEGVCWCTAVCQAWPLGLYG